MQKPEPGDGAQTLTREPRNTITPPRPDTTGGARVLELLLGLGRPPPAVVEEAALGSGGMSVVRLATQETLGRKVAVKRLSPERDSPRDVEALLAEAWLSGSLEHPNIAPVYDLGLDASGRPVLVMKRIEGQSWATLLREPEALAAHAPGRAPLETHLRILIQVCNALHYAHARDVVHRDVKPTNVMVGNFGEVYLLDWGIATRPGPEPELAGTPVYMAPEMLGGERAVISPLTDVYLLGAVLCEVLTGRAPHASVNFDEVVASVRSPKLDFPPEAPEELVALARQCLSTEPSSRPQSARDVRVALEDHLAHAGSLELTRQAEARLRELEALLAMPSPEPRAVFGLFSQCRFGFQQALRDWAGNARARQGLETTVKAMVQLELKSGSARTARALLAELTHVELALQAQVEAAEAEESARVARLAALERSVDPRTGGAARMLTVVWLAIGWVISPLLAEQLVARWPAAESLLYVPFAAL
ncbi:MAG: serine/threonine protein kinase, partial [Myxococcaceae bacterium]|nr:serine/threonine protein kinase [Myxococcaceae bacterium]